MPPGRSSLIAAYVRMSSLPGQRSNAAGPAPPAVAWQASRMPGPTSHSYFSQRLRLHYLDWGNRDAPPLLLIHGNRDHAHNWDWTAARLGERYHIVAPDLRGH